MLFGCCIACEPHRPQQQKMADPGLDICQSLQIKFKWNLSLRPIALLT